MPGLLLLSLVRPVLLVTNVYLCNIYVFKIKRCHVKEFENRNSGEIKALWIVYIGRSSKKHGMNLPSLSP